MTIDTVETDRDFGRKDTAPIWGAGVGELADPASDTPAAPDVVEPDGAKLSKTRPAQKTSAKPARKASPVRQAVERTLAVSALDDGAIGLLCAALDVSRDTAGGQLVADLAVASLEGGDAARSTLTTLTEILDAEDMEAASIATGLAMERAAFKKLWTVLGVLDTTLGNPSSQPAQAGLAAARSIRKLSSPQRKTLVAARKVFDAGR